MKSLRNILKSTTRSTKSPVRNAAKATKAVATWATTKDDTVPTPSAIVKMKEWWNDLDEDEVEVVED